MIANSQGSDLLQKARALVPSLIERAADAEARRHLPEETLRDFADSRLIDILSPRSHGGLEESPQILVEVVKEIGRGCGSSAWVLSLLACHNWLMGRAPDAVQKTLFGNEENLILALTLSTEGGVAEPVTGGYRLSGRWAWLTAIHHANWVALTARLEEGGESPSPDLRLMLLRRDQVQMLDTWSMLGMCATGTHDVRVDDAFVPDRLALPYATIFGEPPADHPLDPTSIYRLPLLALFACINAAPAIGIARAACSEFARSMKRLARSGRDLRPSGLMRLATAEADVDAAEALLDGTLADLIRWHDSRLPLAPHLQPAWRMRAAHSLSLCRRALRRLFDAAGLKAHRAGGSLQRAFRDLQTLSTHIAFDHDAAAQEYGLARLGLRMA